MTIEEQEHIRQRGYALAMRHFAKAREMLSKAGIEDGFYVDARYVRGASGIAYGGVRAALDALAEIKKIPFNKNEWRHIDFYRKVVGENRNLRNNLDAAFYDLQMSGYHDGIEDPIAIESGLESAKEIIDLIQPQQGSF